MSFIPRPSTTASFINHRRGQSGMVFDDGKMVTWSKPAP